MMLALGFAKMHLVEILLVRLRQPSLIIGLLLLTAIGQSASAGTKATVHEQDGILASLWVEKSDVIVEWRFLRSLSNPLQSVMARYNARPLGMPDLVPYPQVDSRTAVLLLLDVSDHARVTQIAQGKI